MPRHAWKPASASHHKPSSLKTKISIYNFKEIVFYYLFYLLSDNWAERMGGRETIDQEERQSHAHQGQKDDQHTFSFDVFQLNNSKWMAKFCLENGTPSLRKSNVNKDERSLKAVVCCILCDFPFLCHMDALWLTCSLAGYPSCSGSLQQKYGPMVKAFWSADEHEAVRHTY